MKGKQNVCTTWSPHCVYYKNAERSHQAGPERGTGDWMENGQGESSIKLKLSVFVFLIGREKKKRGTCDVFLLPIKKTVCVLLGERSDCENQPWSNEVKREKKIKAWSNKSKLKRNRLYLV